MSRAPAAEPHDLRGLAGYGAVLLAVGVALGAFGAHGLEGRLSTDRLATFETAVRYQLVHGVGLLALAALMRPASRSAQWAGVVLAGGASLFALVLYLLALGGPRWLGAVAPLGGAGMIAGWLLVAVALLRR